MVRSFTLVALLVFSSHALAADDAQSAPAEPADMKCIFNGTDLTGWDGDPRLWSVKDGALRGETTAENAAQGNTFIIWKDGVLKDFELRLSFRCNAANNSGIQYRSRAHHRRLGSEQMGRPRLSTRNPQREQAPQRVGVHLRRRGQTRPYVPGG